MALECKDSDDDYYDSEAETDSRESLSFLDAEIQQFQHYEEEKLLRNEEYFARAKPKLFSPSEGTDLCDWFADLDIDDWYVGPEGNKRQRNDAATQHDQKPDETPAHQDADSSEPAMQLTETDFAETAMLLTDADIAEAFDALSAPAPPVIQDNPEAAKQLMYAFCIQLRDQYHELLDKPTWFKVHGKMYSVALDNSKKTPKATLLCVSLQLSVIMLAGFWAATQCATLQWPLP
jgi:hypothetical protein